MKILYIHQYFTTPEKGGGTRSYEFSKYFISQGHKVVMITSHNNKNYVVENIKGIEVHWIPIYYNNSMGIVRRLSSFIHFMFKSFWVAKSISNVNICFATSTPLTVGVTAILLKYSKNFPYIFEVRDLWPEFPIQMGILKNKLLQKVAYFIEKTIYKQSVSIITLSPGMCDGVLKYNLGKEVSVISNSSDLDIFYPHNIDAKIVNKYNLGNKFNIIYFGSMGIANGLEYIINTAKLAKEKSLDDIQFVFIGSGKTEKELKTLTLKYKLENVKFLGFLSKYEVTEIVNICDISITTFLDIPILYTNSPNKLFDSLAAGKVCFVNSKGWTKKLVEEKECGYFVDPSSPENFLEKIQIVKNDTILKALFEKNARKIAEETFSRKKLAYQALNQIISSQN